MNLTDDLALSKILFNQYNTLGKLCSHSKKLLQLDKIIKSVINNPELINNCRIGALINNCLTIEVSRSEYLAQLKFTTIDLLSELRKLPEFSQLITIKYKVYPDFTLPNCSKAAVTVSQQPENSVNNLKKLTLDQKEYLVKSIANISHPDLKQALKKLFNL
ncbi:MAG: hypothetical protein KBD64_07630 [Gammaproteobacteria bacterium]|nr:hypothetical protein [Gammaproteobacteria bacterium]